MTTPTIHSLMPKVMDSIGAVAKDSENKHFGFKFRGIDAVMNAVHGALAKHGVFFAPRIVGKEYGVAGKQRHAVIDVEFVFYGPSGDSITYGPYTGEGMDTSDKATSKALSAALKYLLLHAFCIPTEDQAKDDADRHSPEADFSQRSGAKNREVASVPAQAREASPKGGGASAAPSPSPNSEASGADGVTTSTGVVRAGEALSEPSEQPPPASSEPFVLALRDAVDRGLKHKKTILVPSYVAHCVATTAREQGYTPPPVPESDFEKDYWDFISNATPEVLAATLVTFGLEPSPTQGALT